MKFFVSIFFCCKFVIGFSQDSIPPIQFKATLNAGSSVPVHVQNGILPHGIDLAQEANVTGTTYGASVAVQLNEKWGLELSYKNQDFSYRSKRFFPEFEQRIESVGLDFIQPSGSTDEVSQKEESWIENDFNGMLQYIAQIKNNHCLLAMAGISFSKPSFTSYNYITRIPSTNYFSVYSIISNRNKFQPLICGGIEWRKLFVDESKSHFTRKNHLGLRLTFTYGKVNSNYEITQLNYLNEILKENIQVEQKVCFINISLFFAFYSSKSSIRK